MNFYNLEMGFKSNPNRNPFIQRTEPKYNSDAEQNDKNLNQMEPL